MMLKNLKFFFILFSIAGTCSFSRAGLMLEPYIGYEFGKVDAVRLSTSVDHGGNTLGGAFGGRLGYKSFLGLWAAADMGLLSNGKYSGNSSTYDGKVSRTNLFLDVGFDLPLLLRVWAGLGIVDSQKIDFDNGENLTLKDGGGVKLGVGLTPLPLISINLEYYKSEFKKYSDQSGASGDTSGVFKSSSDSRFILGISLPLNL